MECATEVSKPASGEKINIPLSYTQKSPLQMMGSQDSENHEERKGTLGARK